MAKAKKWGCPNEEEMAKGVIAIFCKGCDCFHHIYTITPMSNGAKWGFNNNLDKPTFTPSLLVKSGTYAGSILVDENDKINFPNGKEWNDLIKKQSKICHSFITDGKIQYLGDCTHELAGQTIELPEIE